MGSNVRIVTAFLFLVFQLIGLAQAGEYVSGVLPQAYPDRAEFEGELAEPPRDPGSCNIYLHNLRYFEQHNLPMSCGQPVAPMLMKKIQAVAWENLNPDKYPALFGALVMQTFGPLRGAENQPSTWNAFLASKRREAKEGALVFRRAKLALTGHVMLPSTYATTRAATRFQVIQFGYDVANPRHPFPGMNCKRPGGRVLPEDLQGNLDFFGASQDLTVLYSRMTDLKDGFSSYLNLWMINGRLYGEQYDAHGNVLLSELRSDSFVRACLFRYTSAK